MGDFITSVVSGDLSLKKYTGEEEVVVIPDGIKVILSSAFDGKNIKEVVFPGSVKCILKEISSCLPA